MFIVLEGLDGVGKSTIIKQLCRKFDAKKIKTPAPWISSLRDDFEGLSDELTCSYYDLCNKIASEEVKNNNGRPIICDRYAVSTASRRLTECHPNEQFRESYFQSLQSWSYPDGLERPDICIHIRLDEEIRSQRVRDRGDMTESEYKLENDSKYRSKILNIFDNLCDITIDVTGLDQLQAGQEVINCINAFYFKMRQSTKTLRSWQG